MAPSPGPRPPVPLSGITADTIPERRRYRLKNKLLGPPLVTEQLSSERLGRPTALGVLAPDCISSSAYGTEEMLTQMVPTIGLAAFALVVPITLAILGVLFFVTLSYLDVIQFYTKAGGAYVVARDNFGPRVAQVAAVALLIDYTVTVAVQTSAGTAALTSAIPSLANTFDTVAITVGVVLLLLYGNLRGIREAGKFFAFPMYFYVVALGIVIITGYIKEALGTLHHIPLPPQEDIFGGHMGTPGEGLLMGLAFITLLRAFANGGSSLTGLEAISNGVGSFRRPASVHARQTLVVMSSLLAFLVLGTSLLAKWTHAVPYASGSPTVVSQEVQAVFGRGFFFFVVQLATLLILYTGGNTSFNGFPFLANFVAGDHYLPRQLTRRGHRLAFSNGILVLAAVSIVLVLVFKARVDGLVALYAIGVFTGFTMAGAGMVKHHLTQKGPHWRRGVAVNAISSFLSGVVVLIFAVVKFNEGAWVIVVVGPLLYFGLIRLHHQYEEESIALETGAVEASEAPILRRHVVVVLVDRLDMATARALQYARTLTPDDLRAVHFDIDSKEARELEEEWGAWAWPGSRSTSSSAPIAASAGPPLSWWPTPPSTATPSAPSCCPAVATPGCGSASCTTARPTRSPPSSPRCRTWRPPSSPTTSRAGWARGCAATASPSSRPGSPTPPPAGTSRRSTPRVARAWKRAAIGAPPAGRPSARPTRCRRPMMPWPAGPASPRAISDVAVRQRVKVAGRVKSVRVQPRAGTSNLECVLSDGTGGLLLVFQGRPRIAGIEPGARLVAEGMVGAWGRRPAMLNPSFELVAGADDSAGD